MVCIVAQQGQDKAGGACDTMICFANHFHPVCNPASCPGDGKHYREHVHWYAKSLVDNTRVELNIRIELVLNEVVVFQRDFFKF